MRSRVRRMLRSLTASTTCAKQQTPSASADTPALKVRGTIIEVDPVGRELRALVNGTRMTFYVPLDSSVLLNGERVKLRLLQPMDEAELLYAEQDGIAVAHGITVRAPADAPNADSAATVLASACQSAES